jgi:hypothetical protein
MMIQEIEGKSNHSSREASLEPLDPASSALKEIEETDVTKGKRSGSPLFKTVAKSRDSYIKNLVKEI